MTLATRSPLLPTYARAAVTFVQGDGAWLTADDGRRFLDFAAGIAVVALGHGHPAPRAAAHEQLERLWHVSNLYWTEPMAALADALSSRFGGAHSFFCNSGAEANEAAIKYARKATGRPGIVALEGSFHGRTTGALAVTGQPGKRAAFEPLLPGVSFARLNDVASLEDAVGPDTALILLEPVQGEGGVRPATPGFLAAAADLAAEHGALLAFDEVQTGVGRTGTFFAFEQLGVRPQLVTLAKGLANGLPIGAFLVAEEAAGAFVPGDHASTFGGNLVASAAACAVVEAIDDDVLTNVRERHAQLTEVLPVRGAGLLLGFDVDGPASRVVEACFDAGLLVTAAGEQTVRLTPPLTVTAEETAHALSILEEVLEP
ncbi:MAG TPA: acetylornithine/succinylornithine family transaminase [Gaiellaceae bacterium]|nr:acetylornithine/succinylornithine family transaminase [Gaiellaceae bacterium]